MITDGSEELAKGSEELAKRRKKPRDSTGKFEVYCGFSSKATKNYPGDLGF